MFGLPKHRRTMSALLAPCLLLVCSCTPKSAQDFIDQFAKTFGNAVKVPQGDTTPPTVVTLTVPDLGSGQHVIGPAMTFPITPAIGPFFVVAVAEDPEGVKSVGFRGAGSVQCTNGEGLGAIVSGDLLSDFPSNAQPGDIATTRRWFPLNVDLRNWGCPDGFRIQTVTIGLHAVGTNFGNQTVSSGDATFSYKP